METSWDDSHGEPSHTHTSWTVSSLWLEVLDLPMTGWHVQSIYSSTEKMFTLPGQVCW